MRTKIQAGVYWVDRFRVENWSNRDQRVWVAFEIVPDSPREICKNKNGTPRQFDTKKQAVAWIKTQPWER